MRSLIKNLFEVGRIRFLTLSVAIAFLGTSLAYSEGGLQTFHAALALISLLFMHLAVNSLNVARDFKRGIDQETEKTDFSGGVDTIVMEKLEYSDALKISFMSFLVPSPIFVYFGLLHNFYIIASIAATAYILSIGYTDFFIRKGLGELSAGIGLGTLPVFYIYYVQSGAINVSAIIISLLMFIPTFTLLLLNELPDLSVDRKYGRINVPIFIGKRKTVLIYGLALLTYNSLVFYIALNNFTSILFVLTVLSSLFGLLSFKRLVKNNFEANEKILKLNVIWVHLSFVLAAIGLFAGSL